MAATEVYQLECVCGKKIELPAGNPVFPEAFACGHCGKRLKVHWRPKE